MRERERERVTGGEIGSGGDGPTATGGGGGGGRRRVGAEEVMEDGLG